MNLIIPFTISVPILWLAILLLASATWLLHQRYQDNLDQFPGPLLASFSDIWRFGYSIYNRHRMPLVDLHRQYGPVVRLGPRMLSFSTPEAIQDIYGSGRKFKKSDFYSVIAPVKDGAISESLFSTRDQAVHSNHRRAINTVFSMTSVLRYEPYLDETTELFFNRLEDISQNTDWIDLPSLFQYYAFDAIGMLAYGKRYGFVEKNADIDGIIKSTRMILDYTSYAGNFPLLDKATIKNPIMLLLGRIGLVKMTTPLIPFAIKSQAGRLAEMRKNPERENSNRDLLDSYLALHRAKPDIVTDDVVLELGVMLGFAGSESTGVALSALIYHIVRNPDVYDRVRTELACHVDAKTRLISYSEAQRMPYFDACVKESFRIHPPSSFVMERVVPPQGEIIAGYNIPGNVIVGCNPTAVHRDKATFGNDADVYRPERWIEADEDQSREMWKAMLHFGSGSHTCLGRHISIMEIYKLGASLLHNYKVTLDQPETDCTITVGQFIRLNFGAQVECVPKEYA